LWKVSSYSRYSCPYSPIITLWHCVKNTWVDLIELVNEIYQRSVRILCYKQLYNTAHILCCPSLFKQNVVPCYGTFSQQPPCITFCHISLLSPTLTYPFILPFPLSLSYYLKLHHNSMSCTLLGTLVSKFCFRIEILIMVWFE
jgi:hypothetical protein